MTLLDSQIRARLRTLPWERDDLDVSLFPDFLVIGPQRTGTTWLARQLKTHPEVLISDPKEPMFLNNVGVSEGQRGMVPDGWRPDMGWYLDCFLPNSEQRAKLANRCRAITGLDWQPRLRGDASASTAVSVSDEVVRDILLIRPGLKAIMLLRDPVERAWSIAKLRLVRREGRHLGDVTDAELHRFFRSPYQFEASQYTKLMDRWSGLLGADRFFVGLFSDLETRPADLYLRVLEFLGVRSDAQVVPAELGSKVNATAASPVPERHRAFLVDLFRDEYRRLADRGIVFEGRE